jgi:hypothetical protein
MSGRLTAAETAGLRLAMKAPERVAALIIQNGDIYEDQLGPKYQALKDWANPTPAPGGCSGRSH